MDRSVIFRIVSTRQVLAIFACAALIVGLGSHAAHAQVLYGSLTGNVVDPAGGAIPGARIELVNVATGIVKQATTDERGGYLFSDLQAGTYNVSIAAPSFSKVIQKGIAIDVNTVRRLDARLQVAQVTESITVAASSVTLQTDRADVNTQIPRAQVANLPLGAGRNFQNLYKIVPGFSPPIDSNSDSGNPQKALVSNVNGMSFSTNSTRLDGASICYPTLPHIAAYVPPAEAVETVNIVTNSFDAEQGMAGGAAINVILKSGTNEYHGSAHWFHTNSAMKARNFFYYDARQPKDIFNQAGGTFGGPIKKNKMFFFADWERTVRRQNVSGFRTVAFDALKLGDFSGTGGNIYDPLTGNKDGSGRQLFANNRIPSARFDPAAVQMLSLLPQPNQTTFPSNYFASGNYRFNRDNADFKVNYNPTVKASMFARYSISPSDLFDPPSLGAAGGDALAGGQPGRAPGRVQSASIGGTYTVSPRIVLDGNIGFTRQRLGAENVDIGKNYGLEVLKIPGTNGPDRLQGGYPKFTISGFSALGNPSQSNPFLFRDNAYSLITSAGWVKGAHSFRFGFEHSYWSINNFQPQTSFGPRGGFTFTGGLTALRGGAAPTLYNGLADFLLGLPQALGKDIQYINPAAVRSLSYGWYARDQWQVSRKLTFSYGMRYEYYPFGRRDHTGFQRYDVATDRVLVGGLGGNPIDTGVDVGLGQIGPRAGLAYRLTDKTVIRAGFGISIDPFSYAKMRDAYPTTISTSFTGNTTLEAAGSLRTGIPEVTGPALSSGVLTLPAALNTITYPTEYRRGHINSFNFTVQRDVGNGVNVQAGYVSARAIRQTVQTDINSAPPGGGNQGRALYSKGGRIGTILLVSPSSSSDYHSLQTQVTKRTSEGSQLGVSYTFSKSIGYGDNSDSKPIWNWAAMWGRNRAIAGFDRPHNLQIYGIYALPFGPGKKWATHGLGSVLVRGWQVNGLFSALSGMPFTVTSAATSVNAPGNTQTADQVLPEVKILGGIGRGESYFDPYAFMPVTAVRFGNSGRNILRGPGKVNLDASLFRDFKLTERFKLQFRAEAFGVTNSPQFASPGANASGPTRNADGTIRALNNYTEITSASGERQLRFALRLFF
jgi:hypothetical protein